MPSAACLIDASAGSGRLLATRAVADYRPLEADVRDLLVREDQSTVLAGASLVVFGARLADGAPVEAVARRLREKHPHIGLFVIATHNDGAQHRLRRLALAGVDDLFLVDEAAECDRFADFVQRRLGAPPPETALRVVGQSAIAQHRAGRVTMWLLRNAYRNPSLDHAAAHFGRHRTTMWRWMCDAGLPDPSTILRCGRLLHVAHLREECGADSRIVADRLGMESAAGVRMMLHRASRDEELEEAFHQLGLGRNAT